MSIVVVLFATTKGEYDEYLLGFNKEKEQVLVYDNCDELLILPFRLFEAYNRWKSFNKEETDD